MTTKPLLEAYLLRVNSALADVEPTERHALLADLRLHLEEVDDDTGGSLDDLVGSPEAYAAELRQAAGLMAAAAAPQPAPCGPSATAELAQVDPSAAWPWVTARVSEIYAPLRGGAGEIALAAREARQDGPWWWLLRGYLAVQLLSALTGSEGGHVWPAIFDRNVLTVPVLYAALLLSVRVGRDPDRIPRRVVTALNLLIVVIGGLHLLFG